MEDYYQILNLQPTATQEEIDRRYRFLVKAYHPDRFQSEEEKAAATEEMKRINATYAVLRDPGKRAEYDRGRTIHATKANESTSSDEYEPDPKLIDYLERLMDKWHYLVVNYQNDSMQENLLGHIIEFVQKLYDWAEPSASPSRSSQTRDKFALISALFAMFNLAIGAEEATDGLTSSFSREDLLRLARAHFELEVAYLAIQAIQIGLVSEYEVKANFAIVLTALSSLQTRYIDAGKASVKHASAGRVSPASTTPPRSESYERSPATKYDSSVTARTDTDEKLDVCVSCLEFTHVGNLSFRRNTGYGFFRQYRKIEGPICANCAEKYFWSFTGHNLIFGWWGVISMTITPFLILMNIWNYLQAWPLRKYAKNLSSIAVGWKSLTVLVMIAISMFVFTVMNDANNASGSSSTYASQPNYSSANATPNSVPSNKTNPTRRPTAVRPTATKDPCLKWSQVTTAHEGKNLCVKGRIYNAYQAEETFFITFSETNQAFRFLVSYGYFSDLKRGDCVRGQGYVELYGKMPYIKLEEIDVGPSSLCN